MNSVGFDDGRQGACSYQQRSVMAVRDCCFAGDIISLLGEGHDGWRMLLESEARHFGEDV